MQSPSLLETHLSIYFAQELMEATSSQGELIERMEVGFLEVCGYYHHDLQWQLRCGHVKTTPKHKVVSSLRSFNLVKTLPIPPT